MNEDVNKIVSYLRSRPWRLIAVAPWSLQLAILYLMTMTLIDCLQNGFRFGVGADAIIPLCVVFTLSTLSLSFRRARIVVGILFLSLVAICLFSKSGRQEFSLNDLGVIFSLALFGILLLCKSSREWVSDPAMIDGSMSEMTAITSAAKSVWRIVQVKKTLLGLVALGVVLYLVGLISTIVNNDADEVGRARRLSAENKYVKEGRLEFDTTCPDLRESFWGLPWGAEPPEGCVAPCEIEYQVRNKPFSKAVFSYDANGLAHVSLSGAQSWDKDKCFLEFMKLRGFYEVKTHAPINYGDEPVDGKYLGVGSGDMTVIVRVDVSGKSNREVVVGLSRPRSFN